MVLDTARALARRVGERNVVRLAVTGLRRCGKTVFTTAFIDDLLCAGQWPELLPFLDVAARGDLIAAETFAPEGEIPAFPYAESIGAIRGDPAGWPKATERLHGLRVSIRYRTRNRVARLLGSATRVLTIELVDYPGEWLLDLPLLAKSYADWSRETLGMTRAMPRAVRFERWLTFLAGIDPGAPSVTATLDQAAKLYASALRDCATSDTGLFLHQPARIVSPGTFALDDPLLAVCPLPPAPGAAPGSFHAVMAERYAAYCEHVVAPFYRDHFRRFDAQIVLVDVLGALRHGQASFDDMRAAIGAVLQSFDYGRTGLRAWLEGARTERVLFAATKADHVSSNQHPNLRRLLEEVVVREGNRIRFRGVATKAIALSSVRCTEDVLGEVQGQTLSMVRGLPVGRTTQTALFPGEIPAHFPGPQDWRDGRFRFLDFLPAPVTGNRGLPHIGIDEAMDYLIGPRLR